MTIEKALAEISVIPPRNINEEAMAELSVKFLSIVTPVDFKKLGSTTQPSLPSPPSLKTNSSLPLSFSAHHRCRLSRLPHHLPSCMHSPIWWTCCWLGPPQEDPSPLPPSELPPSLRAPLTWWTS